MLHPSLRELAAATTLIVVLLIAIDAQPLPAHLNNQTIAKPCATRPESRQFDFWIGDWEVQTPQGQLAGTNNVQLILGDCVLAENWTGTRGGSGKSFNFFDAGTGKWHQVWVDDRGGVLRLTGEFRDGAMRFEGETPAPEGKTKLEKLTFTPLPNGRVRQYWEQSVDGGKTWQAVFDGTYIRKQEAPPPPQPFYSELSWSPDGSRILFSAFVGKSADMFVMGVDGAEVKRLTNGPGVNMC